MRLRLPKTKILGRKTAPRCFLLSPSACHEAAREAGLRGFVLRREGWGRTRSSGQNFSRFRLRNRNFVRLPLKSVGGAGMVEWREIKLRYAPVYDRFSVLRDEEILRIALLSHIENDIKRFSKRLRCKTLFWSDLPRLARKLRKLADELNSLADEVEYWYYIAEAGILIPGRENRRESSND